MVMPFNDIIKKQDNNKYGVIPMPTLTNGVPGYSDTYFTSLAISSNSKNPQLAYDFIKFLATSDNFQRQLSKESYTIPSLLSALNDPYYNIPAWKAGIEQLKACKSMPLGSKYAPIMQALHNAIFSAYDGTKTARAALDAAAESVNAALSKQ
jgi:lactose/L-arabinose transport system substrate-binding protein